jgi:hypothetical protein
MRPEDLHAFLRVVRHHRPAPIVLQTTNPPSAFTGIGQGGRAIATMRAE